MNNPNQPQKLPNKVFKRSLPLVVNTQGKVTLYNHDITDILVDQNYPLWFKLYSDTLAMCTQEDDNAKDTSVKEDERMTDPHQEFGVKPKDFF